MSAIDADADAAELQAEVIRLRERLALVESERDRVQANDMGVAGRVAITRLRDTDFPELVKKVEEIPAIYEQRGYMAAIAYCRVMVRRLVDAIVLSTPRTGDLVRTQHRLHMMLSEGEAEIMFLRGRIGDRARADFLEMVEQYAFAPSVKAAFAHGTETPAGLISPTFPGARG